MCTDIPQLLHCWIFLKVALSQKGLMRLSFLQADKSHYFPELEFWISFHSRWLKSCQRRTWSQVLWMLKNGIWAASSPYLTWFVRKCPKILIFSVDFLFLINFGRPWTNLLTRGRDVRLLNIFFLIYFSGTPLPGWIMKSPCKWLGPSSQKSLMLW